MRKVNILCVCGAGLGTSLMAKMKVDKLLKEVGLKANDEATDAGSVRGQKVDLIVTTEAISKALGEVSGSKKVTVKNFADNAEFRNSVLPILNEFMEAGE